MTADVVQFNRRPASFGHHGIEGLFDTVREYLPSDLVIENLIAPYLSEGLVRRAAICAFARRHRGRVNHIVGDITYAALALPSRGLIVTIHDTGWVRRHAARQALFDLLWVRWPARHASYVTTVSEFTRQQVLRISGCHADQVTVVHNCVHPSFGRSDREYRAGEPEVLLVGTFPNKNLERAGAALEGLPCRLHIVGRLSPQQAEVLERRGLRYRNSVNLDRAALVRAYEDADLLAFPSLYEGFGIPIIEAQAVGRPVVTSRVTSMPEVAGEGACLVDPLDVASIRAGLRRVMESAAYRSELVAAGFENVRRFSARAAGEAYAAIYRQALRDA